MSKKLTITITEARRSDKASRWMDLQTYMFLQELLEGNWIEKRTFHKLLRSELHLCKIAVRCVPHALLEVQKWLRYAIRSNHFAFWQHDCDQFLLQIITIDEFFARAYGPERKRQSVVRQHSGSPRRHKVRQNPSTVKFMAIVTYDPIENVTELRQRMSEVAQGINLPNHDSSSDAFLKDVEPAFE
ncbi:mariner Mos1 transposase [Trichonephila clavipes]|nr:mariner Mos1 transposase [Trichonephila clavipes]